MKSLHLALSIVLFVLLSQPVLSKAQNKEIPLTTSSKEALDYFLKGRDKLENFENTVAATLFEQALQADPNFAMAYLYLSLAGGGLSQRMANLEQATERMNNVSKGEKYFILYVQASYTRNNPKQKEMLDLLLKDFPLDKRVQMEMGNYQYNVKDYKNALKNFTRAAELDPLYAPPYNMIGYTQSKLKDYDRAEQAFQTYIQMNPKSAAGYDSYAELLLQRGDYDRSIDQYKKALECDPNFSYSLVGLGNNYVFKGDYASARKYYERYYEQAPASERYAALNWQAITYIYENQPEQAIAVYNQYCEMADAEKDAYHAVWGLANMGQIYIETGYPQKGMDCYDKAAELIEISGLEEGIRDYLTINSDMWHLYALSANGEFKHADEDETWCTQKVESRENQRDLMTLNSICGYQAFKEGNYSHAIEHFSKADAENPLVAYYYAMAYQKIGDTSNASKLLEMISKCNVNSLSLALARNKAMKDTKKQIAFH